jgi:hypothetical protein
MCEEITECPGTTKLVDELAACGLPLAIATSSRCYAVEKKRLRYVSFHLVSCCVPFQGKTLKYLLAHLGIPFDRRHQACRHV